MINKHITGNITIGSLLHINESDLFTNVNNILLVTSPTVSKYLKVEKTKEILAKNYNLTFFNEIKPNAPIIDLDNLVAKTPKPDLIIGIGGGSVIDSCKALSVAWQGATIIDLFYKKESLSNKKIKTIAVPTTAGTGAELSFGSILYDTKDHIKSGLRGSQLQPNLAFIDIDLYIDAPNKLIAEVGFDCLTHAIETYVSTASTPMVKYQSVAAIQVVFGQLRSAFLKDKNALEKVAIAAALMGINLAQSSTCLPHRIQYALGPKTNTSHAQGLIMLYKGWLTEIKDTEVFNELAHALGLTTTDFVENIIRLKQDLNIDYSLADYGVNSSDILEIASNVTGNMDNDPCYKSKETIISILQNSL
ncbi:iron-containing alcohol dehydrogenase [Emticicia sp. SJ17W-69]|uniref:iron-containing alcohol dehydrogenase n=1 Tax=Emticicia sp. SJ17W-69 TaxID=3421657 RepID=UPI003EBB992C